MPRGADDPQALAHHIATFYAGDGPSEARLGAIFRRYSELRGKLALANMRLVAHVAKRFRDRGVSYSDLLQEGFCGLLEAIDRFDLTHETKLATYATWWIRQSMQRAVAAGAYPVRLSPRHLRQLAQNQDEVDTGRPTPAAGRAVPGVSTEMIRRIHTATRPTISLDATLDSDSNFNLMQTMSDPEGDRTGEVDMDETVGKMMDVLRPREQQVLALRFGLGGKAPALAQPGRQGPRSLQGTGPPDPGPGPREAPRRRRRARLGRFAARQRLSRRRDQPSAVSHSRPPTSGVFSFRDGRAELRAATEAWPIPFG